MGLCLGHEQFDHCEWCGMQGSHMSSLAWHNLQSDANHMPSFATLLTMQWTVICTVLYLLLR